MPELNRTAGGLLVICREENSPLQRPVGALTSLSIALETDRSEQSALLSPWRHRWLEAKEATAFKMALHRPHERMHRADAKIPMGTDLQLMLQRL